MSTSSYHLEAYNYLKKLQSWFIIRLITEYNKVYIILAK